MVKHKLLFLGLLLSLISHAQEHEYDYSFFSNSAMPGDYFFSATDNSGSFIYNRNFKVLVSEKIFHTPGNALQLGYINAKNGFWKATIYRPAKRGMDHFKKAAFLSLWIFNPSAETALNELPVIQLMKMDSSLTTKVKLPVIKAKEWQQVLIPTSAFKEVDPNKPANMIGIVFSQQEDINSKRQTIYIDDIEFLAEKNAPEISETAAITKATGYPMHVDLSWKKPIDKNVKLVKIYRSENDVDYTAVGVQQLYISHFADYTGETGKKYFYKISFLNNNHRETKLSAVAEAATRSMTDDELLSMLQEASFRYYWDGAEATSGLAKENSNGRQNMIATGASGFGIMALIAGAERKFITRKEAVDRFAKIVSFLDKAENFHGVYPRFINGPSGKAESFLNNKENGADLVETSFLLQGLLAARQYFSGNDAQEKLIRDKITSIWKKTEWDWFRQDANSKFLYRYGSTQALRTNNLPLIGWSETMAAYLLAIASPTHPVPASMYYSGWANQDEDGKKYRSEWVDAKEGLSYTSGQTFLGIKLDVGVRNGGPLVSTQYSYLGYDPRFITDNYTNYFRNNQKIVKLNHRYCVENPKRFNGYSDSAWGITASDGPFGYVADEPLSDRDHGKIAPTGAVSSMPYTPAESMKALKNYYFNHGKFLWGEYGFRDAFDLNNNWCSEIYTGANQAPMVVMIENHRTGLLWKLFMNDPDVKAGMEKLQQETTLMINKRRE